MVNLSRLFYYPSTIPLQKSRNPSIESIKVWALPFSLATTQGVSYDFFSSGYLDVSVYQVRFYYLWIQ